MKILCLIIALSLMLSLCGCSRVYARKSDLPVVTEETTYIRSSSSTPENHIIQMSNLITEPVIVADGKTDKHLACVIRVKDNQASTLLINLYDELGRITSTTNGDVSIDYEYDKDSRVTKESKYYKGLYQGYSIHQYFNSMHAKTSYAADGKILYDGETYEEYFNSKGQLSGKNIYTDEKNEYTNIGIGYDRKTGWIINDYMASRSEVLKEEKHSYAVNQQGNLEETVTDNLTGKKISTTTYMGKDRSEDKILQYEEYDPDGNARRGYENKYVELNGRYVLKEKNSMEINAITGKIKADIYYYSTSTTSKYSIDDDIYEKMGMDPDDFSRLTVHMMSSGYFDFAVTYDSTGEKMRTVSSQRDDSGRVVGVRETGRYGTVTLIRTYEYDESGNCRKMTIKEGNKTTEYIFGYMSVPGVFCDPFSCADAEEYIGK